MATLDQLLSGIKMRAESRNMKKLKWDELTDGICSVLIKYFIISIFCKSWTLMLLWSKVLCCPLVDSLMIFLWLFSLFDPLTLHLRPLLGAQWYLVFGLRREKCFRNIQMSRVQLRGESHPLPAAAGQRSVLNCQSSGENWIPSYLLSSTHCDVQVNKTPN